MAKWGYKKLIHMRLKYSTTSAEREWVSEYHCVLGYSDQMWAEEVGCHVWPKLECLRRRHCFAFALSGYPFPVCIYNKAVLQKMNTHYHHYPFSQTSNIYARTLSLSLFFKNVTKYTLQPTRVYYIHYDHLKYYINICINIPKSSITEKRKLSDTAFLIKTHLHAWSGAPI